MNSHTRPKQENQYVGAKRFRLRLLRALVAGVVLLLAGNALATPDADVRPTAANEAGLPFIHNFDAIEYGGSPQNWSVTQGKDGVVYVGNGEAGVLTFDGNRWGRITVPNQLTVRSLATGPEGRIYVGLVGDFGYLARDASGRLGFVSLLDKLPANERDFADVWRIHVNDAGVYFATEKYLFHLRDGHIHTIKPENSIHLSFLVSGVVYVRETGEGLFRLVGDQLTPVPGGEMFAEKRIYALLPWPHGKPGELLAATRSNGWFVFNGTDWQPWEAAATTTLDKTSVYAATWLADGRLAVATTDSGLFLLDSEGRLLRQIDRVNGLSSNVALALYQDHQQGLWVGTGNGISRVDVGSLLTHFGEQSGVEGIVLDILRHDGVVYTGTAEGLFRLTTDAGGNAAFKKIPGISGWDWNLLSFGHQLLVANHDGVFSVDGDGSARAISLGRLSHHTEAARPLLRSRRNPSRVFVGYEDGLGSLLWSNGHWVDEGLISGVHEQVNSLAEDADGGLWLGLNPHGVDRVILPADWSGPGDARAVSIERFAAKAGLPDGETDVVDSAGKIRFLTNNGVYRFDPHARRMTPDAQFANLFPDGKRQISGLQMDPRGQLWMYTANPGKNLRETGRAVRVNGHWQWQVTPLQPIAGTGIYAFHADHDGVVWMGGDRGVFRYDPRQGADGNAAFKVLIREVSTHDGRVLYAGRPDSSAPQIPYTQNALRFEFAAPSYNFFSANTFQVLLQGLDRNWSPWNSDSYRDYTNVPEGRYKFRVHARNIYGDEGKEASFDFVVLPPWYRTDWAWAIWVAIGVLVLGLLLRWRSAALRRHNRALAALVALRTAELAQANEALQDSNSALAEQSVTDPLTGLKNRRYLYDHIAQDVAMARRNRRDQQRVPGQLPLNSDILFLMIDIDHFKEINDTHGHAAGDRVLQQFRDILQSVARETDIPIRWGGEEFLIVARFALPDIGPKFAERIRVAVAAHNFDLGDGQSIHRTCSVGFATYPALGDEPDRLGWEQIVNLADECLYAAKHHGRNAWAGVLPLATSPDGEIVDAVRAALAQPPGSGPLHVATSWTSTAP